MRPASRPEDMPQSLAVFPLPGVLLLPRSRLPLNIFEPRYLAMIKDAMSLTSVIGMIQPAYDARPEEIGNPAKQPALLRTGCAGAITSFSETGDGRILITLTGIARFEITGEPDLPLAYRKCDVDFSAFAADFGDRPSAMTIDRDNLLKTLAAYLKAHKLEADWSEIERTGDEALVNGMCMLAPYGVKDKQALLEAPDLAARCDLLIAMTRMDLAGTAAGGKAMQ